MKRLIVIAAFGLAASWVCGVAVGQTTITSSAETPEYVLLKMQMLMTMDPTITDPAEQQRKLLDQLRQIPAMAAKFDAEWPTSQYRPLAKSTLIDALTILGRAGDPAGSPDAILAAANELLKLKASDGLQAKARFTMLGVELNKLWDETVDKPDERKAKLPEFAKRYISLWEDLPKTIYAPAALYAAGMVYVQIGKTSEAAEVLERLAGKYPKDNLTLDGLMLLISIYTAEGKDKQAIEAKRKVVAEFSETLAGMKYRSDLAHAEVIGKPFHLRFRAMDATRYDIRDHRGKTVYVYFFLSASTETLAKVVADDIAALVKFAADKGVVMAIGADRQTDAAGVAALLKANNVGVPVLLDDQLQVASQYGVAVAPSLAVVDGKGVLRAIICGPRIVEQLKVMRSPTTRPDGRINPLPTTRATTLPAEKKE